ncbi:MAG: hypothetical protein JSU81_01360 [Candidatus Coatesbacteria bacterium]|nr:MAG: hypothetical protein JSU81_01360 [Candidatus Coatesbacteria bacterium]
MGGKGSGRTYLVRKTAVEECCEVAVSDLAGGGPLRPGVRRRGGLAWCRGGGVVFALGYALDTADPAAAAVRLGYASAGGEEIEEVFRLEVTRPNYGGVRFWFTCPGCGRRRRKLYLPPRRRLFRCRECYDLTYESCRESHRYDRLFAELGEALALPAAAVEAVIKGGR